MLLVLRPAPRLNTLNARKGITTSPSSVWVIGRMMSLNTLNARKGITTQFVGELIDRLADYV